MGQDGRRVPRESEDCRALGWCYCARNETDGHVPAGALVSLKGTKRQVAELIAARRWRTNGKGGWVIHDYLKYNPSAKELAQKRAEAKKRMDRLRDGSQ